MSKEDYGIITTTQKGILNTLQVMSNEIAYYTDIILKKIRNTRQLEFQLSFNATPAEKKITFRQTVLTKKRRIQKEKKTTAKEEEIKPKLVCFTCGEPGHFLQIALKKKPKIHQSKVTNASTMGKKDTEK